MANNNNNDPFFNVNSYISFDATSVKNLIIDRLNQGQVFTDQNYEGSNFSAFIDVISYCFSTLLYYLNKTSSESMFSESQIYENMNRIVKLINYNPKGKFAQTLSYNLSATSDLPDGNFIIPRYSYVNVGGTKFSFNSDIYFTNSQQSISLIQNAKQDLFLYQGVFSEYPTYNAFGNDNEVVYVNLGGVSIDHFNIHVYVKSSDTNTWEQWTKTENLFLNNKTDKVFEIRYNPNQNYEIKFGDNINGMRLSPNDKVLVYYLEIDTNALTVGANALSQSSGVVFYNSLNYQEIQNNVLFKTDLLLNTTNINYITLSNDYPSNPYLPEESVDTIRKNAPKKFTNQQRLVTVNDFQNYIIDNHKSMLADAKVINNNEYLKGHMKYLYDIGLSSPQLENRVLFNQIKFATSCNFNNIYVYMVPLNATQKYILAAQKEYVLNSIESMKVLTSEVVPVDPVYMYFDFYVKDPNNKPSINDIANNKLLIYKKANSNKTSSGILSEVIAVITNAFSKANMSLGQLVNTNQIASDILNIEGVDHIKTYRSDLDLYTNGISFLVWNESYPTLDINVYAQNVQLQYFQYPIFNTINDLMNRISIIEQTGVIQITDY